jgi:hypothetical protein
MSNTLEIPADLIPDARSALQSLLGDGAASISAPSRAAGTTCTRSGSCRAWRRSSAPARCSTTSAGTARCARRPPASTSSCTARRCGRRSSATCPSWLISSPTPRSTTAGARSRASRRGAGRSLHACARCVRLSTPFGRSDASRRPGARLDRRPSCNPPSRTMLKLNDQSGDQMVANRGCFHYPNIWPIGGSNLAQAGIVSVGRARVSTAADQRRRHHGTRRRGARWSYQTRASADG